MNYIPFLAETPPAWLALSLGALCLGLCAWMAVALRRYAHATDIAERKRAEDALRESEILYRTTINAMTDAIHVVDRDLRITIFNDNFKQWCRELELDTNAVGRRVNNFFPFLSSKVLAEYKRVFATGEMLATEETTYIAGKAVITETRKIPIREENETRHVVTVVRDITERKRAEKALKKQAEETAFLNRIIASANEASEIDPLIAETLRVSLELLDLDMGGVFLLDSRERTVHLRCHINLPPDFVAAQRTLPIDEMPYKQVFLEGRPLIEENYPAVRPEIAKQSGIQSLAAMPLVDQNNTVVGAINLAANTPHTFTQSDIAILKSIAREVGAAIARIQDKETQRRFQQLLRGAAEANHIILTTDDYDTAIPTALETLGRAADVDRVFVFQNEEPADANAPFASARFGWTRNNPLPDLNGARFHWDWLKHRQWYDTLTTGKSIAALTRELLASEQAPVHERGVCSAVIAPIIVYGQLWGCMTFADCHSERRWSEDERATLVAVAISIGSALVRKEAEDQLGEYASRLERINRQVRNEKVRTEQVLQGIADGVVVADREQRVVLVNPAARKLLAVSDKVGEGQSLDILFSHCTFSKEDSRKIFSDEHFNRLSVALAEPDGRTLDISCAVYLDETAKPAGRVFVLRDTTRAREIERMKTRFVSAVSHELRTPLTSIKGFTGTLLRDPEMSAETRAEFLSIIDAETRRLTDLIENILDLSRIESGKIVLKPRPLNVKQAVERVLSLVAPALQRKRISHRCNLPDNLPATETDPDSLQTILDNLIGNAIKFTPDGGRITARAFAKDRGLVIEVSDTGLGIPEKDLPHIFDTFYRVERPGVEIPGTGLGLSIVQEHVRRHGGRIEAASTPGQGSTFTLWLPLKPVEKDKR